jgi:glycosyltransferase 2 family protein
MKKLISKITLITFSIIIGLSLVVWVLKEVSIKEMINLFIHGNHVYVFWFLCASLVILIFHSIRWKLIINTIGKNISLFKLLQYKIAGMGLSFLTPGAKVGGEPIRALLLKKHNIDFGKGLSTVVTDKIVDLSVQGVLFVIAATIAMLTISLPENLNYLLAILIILTITTITYVYYQIFNDKNLFLKIFRLLRLDKIKRLKDIEEDVIEFEKIVVSFHKHHQKEFYLSIFVTILAWFTMFFEIYYAGALLGFELGFMKIFMIITIMGIAYLIPIPMALGVFEAGEIAVFRMFSLNPVAGVGMAMIIRTRDLIYCFLGFLILGINGITWKKIKKNTDFTEINPLDNNIEEEDYF